MSSTDWTPLAYWLILLYIQAFSYVIARPGLSLATRLATWLLLTPLLSLFQLLLIRPAMYFAVSQIRNSGWVTRHRIAYEARRALLDQPVHIEIQTPELGMFRQPAIALEDSLV